MRILAKNPQIKLDGAPAPAAKLPKIENGAVIKKKKSPEERMNGTEKKFFAYLKTIRTNIRVRPFPLTFICGDDTRYTPDFQTVEALYDDDLALKRIVFYEVKGPYIWARSLNKFKMLARERTEFTWKMAQWENGIWTITEYK